MKKLLTVLTALSLCAVILFSYTSCALRVSAGDLTDGYSRKAADVVLTDEEKTAGQTAFYGFAMNLFTETVSQTEDADKQNLMISPLSAMVCLAMIANGADGETKAQMEAVLGLPVDALNTFLYDYWSNLYTADDCKVEMADSVWFNTTDRLEVKPAFLQSVADWYAAQAYAAPFDQSTVKDVNNWCKDKTDGMIDKIIDRLSPDDMMILINALMFDAKWYTEYEKKDIRDRAFNNADGTTATVDMLYSEEHTFLWGDDFRAFTKAYKGSRYSFMGILPDEGVDMMTVAKGLTGDVWAQTWANREYRPVNAGIPEFSFDFETDMTETLKALGMTDLFHPVAADLAPMAVMKDGNNLYCGEVRQKTHIELDRNGTKAAAITWGIMKCGSAAPVDEPVTIILDRPFLYAIVDNYTGMPLFVGMVNQLS